MAGVDTDRFRILSGECPGEGVWCWAKTYTDLVKCVQDAWGHTFKPIFRYELPCTLTDANAHTRREASSEAEEAEDGVATIETNGADLPAPVPSKTRLSKCLVVLNDADDFCLWRYGGAYLSATDACSTPAAYVHHHGSPEGSAESLMHAVSHHMSCNRIGSGAHCPGTGDSATRSATPPTAQGQEGEQERVWEPRMLTSTLYAFSSFAHTTQRRLSLSRCSCGDMMHMRASPPVRRADADVIQAPLQCILDPTLVLRLGVSVVLRHSATPAEVILFSGNTPTGQGELPWGALCLKARHAWGVHSPQFRYVDFTRGVTQMLINHVNDYRAWAQKAQLENRELLVVEQAPSAARGASFASPESQAEICRYYAEEWPVGRYGSSKSLVELLHELKTLEREERIAAVMRRGRETTTHTNGDLIVATAEAKPLSVTDASTEPLPVDADLALMSNKVTVASVMELSASPSPTEYRPILLRQRSKHPKTASAQRSRSSGRPRSMKTSATIPLCAPGIKDEDLDAEIWDKFMIAKHCTRSISPHAPKDPAAAADSIGADREAGAEGRSSSSPQMAIVTPASPDGNVSAMAGDGRMPLCPPVSSACKDYMGSSAAVAQSSRAVIVEESALDGHERAIWHNELLTRHFRTHSPNVASARGIGATPVW